MICIAKLLAVNHKPLPMTPDALRIEEALRRSQPLARLKERLQESQARFKVVSAVLPTALVAHIKPGPVDDEGWSLLAANAAVAAKLRQLQPRLEEALRHQGWQGTSIRIRVQSN
jgi:hypothetical protein